MTRSPLAYPLNRGADMDVGGAADLQTDVMRFMAIISLCLVAIFALVQSMPIAPVVVPTVVASSVPEKQPEPQFETTLETIAPITPQQEAAASVVLTRPKWTPAYLPKLPPAAPASPPEKPVEAVVAQSSPPVEEADGFTLRFESDAALTRLVAASQVNVYAIDNDVARRMTVSQSRISFWDASVPNSFHEMQVSTVPRTVVDALARSGVDTSGVSWGVTLPGKLKIQLDRLMQEHRGGSLLIGTNGDLRLEET